MCVWNTSGYALVIIFPFMIVKINYAGFNQMLLKLYKIIVGGCFSVLSLLMSHTAETICKSESCVLSFSMILGG